MLCLIFCTFLPARYKMDLFKSQDSVQPCENPSTPCDSAACRTTCSSNNLKQLFSVCMTSYSPKPSPLYLHGWWLICCVWHQASPLWPVQRTLFQKSCGLLRCNFAKVSCTAVFTEKRLPPCNHSGNFLSLFLIVLLTVALRSVLGFFTLHILTLVFSQGHPLLGRLWHCVHVISSTCSCCTFSLNSQGSIKSVLIFHMTVYDFPPWLHNLEPSFHQPT